MPPSFIILITTPEQTTSKTIKEQLADSFDNTGNDMKRW